MPWFARSSRTRGEVGPGAILRALAALVILSSACSSSESQTFTGPTPLRCTPTLLAESTAFTAAGGSGNVRITINRECQWSASAEAAWIALSSREGQGEGSFSFTVASNTDPASRNTSIVVNDQRLQIGQQGRPCTFALSSDREVVDASGGVRTIHVGATSAQCTWTAGANEPWITIVSGARGLGDGEVSFSVAPDNGPPRTGTLTIAGESVQVEQGTGCPSAIANETVVVPLSGGDGEVAVSAGPGCAWTAQSSTPWITILSGRTGSGAGTVVFRVPATNGPERTGTLTVAGRTVTVVQGGDCTVTVNPLSLNAPAAGSTSAIQVDTAVGCGWSAVSEVPWISISGPASGSGRAPVPLAITANIGPARSGAVVVSGHRIVVAQASGCSYAVSPATQQISGSGGPAAASVSTPSGCAWNAASGVTWITMATTSGNGPGSATFTVAPNLSPARSATLTIAGQNHTVNQASQCTWSFGPPSRDMPAAGGFGITLVFVSGGACSWTATSTVDWISVTSVSSGPGGGNVQYTVSPNTGPARTGTILIAGEAYVIAQQGAQLRPD